jgi:hypothetical protein
MAERVPPSRDLLARLLRERRPVPIAEAAALLGWPAAQVEREAAGREALLPGGLVQWGTVALWVVESWPFATLFETLGPDTDLLPRGLQPIPMHLEQPAYIVTALRTQWQIEAMPHRTVRPLTFTDYLTDLLHRAIDPDTVEAMRDDEEFMRAYEFPYEEQAG